MLTNEQLQQIMPKLSDKRSAELLQFLQAAMTEFLIETPGRAAAFLAQLAHESGQFQFMEEIWGPTAAQQRYEPETKLSADLGNTEPGDGKLFKGRGPIQITGRANYHRFGDLLGVELLADPSRAALADLAFRIAGLFWSKKGLNELADQGTDQAFREITRRINGGFNGLDERRKFYAVARTVLGVPASPAATAERSLVPPAEEPVFSRGQETIRAHVRRKPTRKAATAGRKKTAGPRKTARPRKTRSLSGSARRAKTPFSKSISKRVSKNVSKRASKTVAKSATKRATKRAAGPRPKVRKAAAPRRTSPRRTSPRRSSPPAARSNRREVAGEWP